MDFRNKNVDELQDGAGGSRRGGGSRQSAAAAGAGPL
jgi:hypothetical protein